MQKTITYCDHCGKELDIMKDYCDMKIDVCSHLYDVDLCTECYRELDYMISQFCQFKISQFCRVKDDEI